MRGRRRVFDGNLARTEGAVLGHLLRRCERSRGWGRDQAAPRDQAERSSAPTAPTRGVGLQGRCGRRCGCQSKQTGSDATRRRCAAQRTGVGLLGGDVSPKGNSSQGKWQAANGDAHTDEIRGRTPRGGDARSLSVQGCDDARALPPRYAWGLRQMASQIPPRCQKHPLGVRTGAGAGGATGRLGQLELGADVPNTPASSALQCSSLHEAGGERPKPQAARPSTRRGSARRGSHSPSWRARRP